MKKNKISVDPKTTYGFSIVKKIICYKLNIITMGFAVGVIIIVYYVFLELFFKLNSETEKSDTRIFKFSDSFDNIPLSNERSLQPIMDSSSDNIQEALTTTKAAMEMEKLGKLGKAEKLFEHAMVLCPNNPDVLNFYGEFMEKRRCDVVKADHLYTKALIISPRHDKALINLERVSNLVAEIDDAILKSIDEKRDNLARLPTNDPALQRAKREAYFQHIYHTVGIEGNTMTLSQTRSVVETKMAVCGKSIAEHNEILGMDAAMTYIDETIVKNITLDTILELHKRIMGYVDPIDRGTFRISQVFVGDHVPPGPEKINKLMSEFEKWLNSKEARSLHPVTFAALAHYKLVYIHPFIDGNGRTSRLLMNMILINRGFPPVIIWKEQRHRYYETLDMANKGDVRPFIRFIASCTETTLDLLLWTVGGKPIEGATSTSIDHEISTMNHLMISFNDEKSKKQQKLA